eukprot:2661084-Rhodomonas_salina.1
MAVMPLPGKVIAEAVKFTRAKSILDPPVSFAGYMQISDDMIYDEATQTLTHICNEPVDPEKIYTMGIKFLVMAGEYLCFCVVCFTCGTPGGRVSYLTCILEKRTRDDAII